MLPPSLKLWRTGHPTGRRTGVETRLIASFFVYRRGAPVFAPDRASKIAENIFRRLLFGTVEGTNLSGEALA